MSRCERALFDRFVAACGCDENDVMEVRASRNGFEVDVVDFADPLWPVRTFIVDLAEVMHADNGSHVDDFGRSPPGPDE